jgi:hypothetical protein
MKQLLIAMCVLVLAGCCHTVPVKQNFPRASDTLQQPPPTLKQVPAGASASVIFDTVIENYGTYNEVANQLTGWQQWYIEQKKIFDKVDQ